MVSRYCNIFMPFKKAHYGIPLYKVVLTFMVNSQSVTFIFSDSSSDGSLKPKAAVYIGFLREAQFPGAETGWLRFLNNNLKADITAGHNAPDGFYKVIVSFVINEEGYISEVHVLNDPGYGTAEEAIRVFKKSPGGFRYDG
jgi:hypothetical protein